jgi:response regulator of citrate/malate metabolism
VDRALTCGAFAYVVKPFTRATIDAKLADFVSFRRSPIATRPSADQRTIERIYNWRRSSHPLPAGLLRETLDAVVTVLRAAERPLRAEEIAARSGLKRETANRYLIYLSDQGIAVRAPEHGRPGHPAYLYTLAAMWNAPATP